jgi:hypothetical protein
MPQGSFGGESDGTGGGLNTQVSETYFREVDFENIMKVTFTNRYNNFILRILFTCISLKIYNSGHFKNF